MVSARFSTHKNKDMGFKKKSYACINICLWMLFIKWLVPSSQGLGLQTVKSTPPLLGEYDFGNPSQMPSFLDKPLNINIGF